MRNDRKRISVIAAALMLLVIPAISQINTYSPYTRFGLGDMARGGFGQNHAMGGTGLAIRDENKLNYENPAAYTARDSMSVLLDVGVMGSFNQYKTNSHNNVNWGNGNFNHFALSVPIGKWAAIGSGLVPYSNVGYTIKQEYDDLGTGDAINFYHTGEGGIMKFFLGGSIELLQRVSIGANMNFLLGDIDRQRIMTFPKNRGFASTTSYESIRMHHTYFSLGLQYKETFGDKFYFTLGGLYEMETQLGSSINSTVINSYPGNDYYLNDSTTIGKNIAISSDEDAGDITIPTRYGGGIALGIPDKLTVTADYYSQDWSSVSNNSILKEGFNLAAAKSKHFGVEYTPNFSAFRGYHKLMSYRLGYYTNDTYVTVNGYQIKDSGITFGVGLPLGKTKSSMNVAFTLGTRGTLENNLIKENYGILTFSLTLHDLWFYKRKFD